MSYNSGTPASSDSPAQLPTQNQTNWKRLKAIIETDHQFNDPGGAGTADGYHKVIQLDPQTAPGATPSLGKIYARTSANVTPYYQYPNSSGGAIPEAWIPTAVAVGMFNGRSGDGACTAVGETHNMTCARLPGSGSGGDYQVTMTSGLPDTNYFVFVNVDSNTSPKLRNRTTTTFDLASNIVGNSGRFQVIVFYLPPAP